MQIHYVALVLCASFAAACSAADPNPEAHAASSAPTATAQAPAATTTQAPPAAPAAPAPPTKTMDFYSLHTRTLEGQPVDLADYRGKVSLVVNVASQCGYTPQYTGLQALQERYEVEGFEVLGFPSNDFGGQEPGSPEEIRTFCTDRYHVGFPMFEKVQTKSGEGQSPIYSALADMGGQLPRWNFGKYLVGRDGKVLAYFDSKVTPESGELRGAIEKALVDG